MAWTAGTLIDNRYELSEPLPDLCGGAAWRAHDPDAAHRRFTLIALAPVVDGAEGIDGRLRALRTLRHAHLAPVLGYGHFDGVPYLALGPLEGVGLAAFVGSPRRGHPLATLRAVWSQVAEAVRAGHRASPPAVHGDVNPDDVVVGEIDGAPSVKVVGTGLSTLLDARQVLRHGGFVAPERTHATAPTVAGDVCSLARMLGWMLQETARERDAAGAWPGLRARRDVPDAVWAVLDAAGGAAVEARPATVQALVEALEAAWSHASAAAQEAGAATQEVVEPGAAEAAPPPIERGGDEAYAVPAEAPLVMPSLAPREENPWATDVRHRPFEVPAGFAIAPTPEQAPVPTGDENPWGTNVRQRPFRVEDGAQTRAVSAEMFRDAGGVTTGGATQHVGAFAMPDAEVADDEKETVAVPAFRAAAPSAAMPPQGSATQTPGTAMPPYVGVPYGAPMVSAGAPTSAAPSRTGAIVAVVALVVVVAIAAVVMLSR